MSTLFTFFDNHLSLPHASIDVNSSYKFGYVGGRHEKKAQVFSKVCVGGKGVYRKHTNGRIFSCESCEAFR